MSAGGSGVSGRRRVCQRCLYAHLCRVHHEGAGLDCAEACDARGSTCATNGCGGYTYRIYSFLEWCEDPERVGVEVEHDCDAPIDWQVNDAVKCCCEQEN